MSRRSEDGSAPPHLWDGRFSSPPSPQAEALGRSLGFDVRLAPQDVDASIAHVEALHGAGLLDDEERTRLHEALRAVGEEIAAGTFAFDETDEDVHSAIERAVTERLGEVGAKLHAGRSRNDLVATDLRLWMLASAARVETLLGAAIETLSIRAREHAGTVMPGVTHARPAQPVTLGHHLLAHGWALSRDRERLQEWARRASISGLGAGAIATSTLGLDASATARRLGMDRAFANSIDAVSDRDFVQEFLAVASICATHLSRLAADLARWTEGSRGWATLDEAYSTGSSMMPHKRNPDTAELVRGKAARVAGDFGAVTAVLQGLPLGYHRDLQEDKEPVFDAVDTLELTLPAITGAVATIRFHVDAMRRDCEDEGLYATDLAEALVRDGVPFREAHRRIGRLVRELEENGRTLRELSAQEWSELGIAGGAAMLDPEVSIAARSGVGGPTAESVMVQADALDALSRP